MLLQDNETNFLAAAATTTTHTRTPQPPTCNVFPISRRVKERFRLQRSHQNQVIMLALVH